MEAFFERGICNDKLIDTIIDLKFEPEDLITGKHKKGLARHCDNVQTRCRSHPTVKTTKQL